MSFGVCLLFVCLCTYVDWINNAHEPLPSYFSPLKVHSFLCHDESISSDCVCVCMCVCVCVCDILCVVYVCVYLQIGFVMLMSHYLACAFCALADDAHDWPDCMRKYPTSGLDQMR